jgi:hypothetical protein
MDCISGTKLAIYGFGVGGLGGRCMNCTNTKYAALVKNGDILPLHAADYSTILFV